MSVLTNMFKPSAAEAPKVEYTSQQKKTAMVMLILTGLYLTMELAFNARLLDVVGSLEGGEAIEGLEKYGRLISGTAVALLVLGKILGNAAKKKMKLDGYFFSMFWIALLCGAAMVGVYFGQKKLVDTLVDNSSDEDRRRAAVLVPMSKLIKTGVVGVPSLALDVKDYDEPAGKSFLATLPLQAIAHPTLFKSLEGTVPDMFRAFSEQERKYSDGFYNNYKKSIDTLKEQYDGEYQAANKRYKSEFGLSLMARQQDAWNDYSNRLRQQRRNLKPNNVPSGYWKRVRDDVRSHGVPVPNNWNPGDRGTFNAAIERRVHDEALSKFHSESQSKLKLKRPLDPGLDFDAFMRSEAVQSKWKENMKVPNAVPLRVGLTLDQFIKDVYEPSVDADVKDLMLRNYASAEMYGKGKRFQKTGEDAYRALIVPPIALVFSLLGAMTHIFKVMMFTRKLVSDVSAKLYWGCFGIYLSLVAIIPLTLSNKVTNQALYLKLEKYTQDGGGFVKASGIRWATQFQPYFYPVNDSVSRLMGNPKFDEKIEFLENIDKRNIN